MLFGNVEQPCSVEGNIGSAPSVSGVAKHAAVRRSEGSLQLPDTL